VYLGEPVVLVVVSIVLAPLLGIIVGEPELGVVSPEHGALLEGVLYQALMVWAGSFKHVVEEPWASRILAVCGHDEPGLENLLFPLASLLFLGGRDVEAPGVSSRLFPLESLLGKMAPTASSPEAKLVAMSRSADVVVGTLRPNSRTRSRQVVPERNAWMISESPTLGNSVHCLEKRRMKSRRDSSGPWRQLLRSQEFPGRA